MKIHESGAYLMGHAQVSLKSQQVFIFYKSCKVQVFNIWKIDCTSMPKIILIDAIFCFRIVLTLCFNKIRIAVQKYNARVIEVVTDTLDQTLVHINWPD